MVKIDYNLAISHNFPKAFFFAKNIYHSNVIRTTHLKKSLIHIACLTVNFKSTAISTAKQDFVQESAVWVLTLNTGVFYCHFDIFTFQIIA